MGLKERGLWTPLQAREVGILTVFGRTSVGLANLALSTALFFVSLLDPSRLFTITFRNRRFSWSSDDALLAHSSREQ